MTRALSLVLLVLLPGLGLAQDAPPAATFAGEWKTTFGPLTLSQEGRRVTGTYTQDGEATLSGTLEGRRLTFRYTEASAHGEGWFELSRDGEAFNGQWRQAETRTWSEWTGTRVVGAKPRGPFEGLFETPVGRIRFSHTSEDAVTGVYTYEGASGALEGSLSGRTLRFTWSEGSEASGTGTFTLSADGNAIRGAWQKPQGPATPWAGTRVAPRPNVKWLMILEAHWETTLAEQEYSFGAMLRAYFRRYPQVQVRQRRFNDRPDFLRAAREIALLGEDVVLVVASHGEKGKLVAGRDHVDPKQLGEILNTAPNVKAVHFSSCEMMLGDVPEGIQSCLKGRRIPLSGYSVTVDWSASAILEFLYLDLVLGRGLSPRRAAAVVRSELNFSSDTPTDGSPLGASHFRFVE